MTEHRVAVEPQRIGERADVPGHPLDGPGLRRGAIRPALATHVHQHQVELVAKRVEVVGKLMVIEAGTAVHQDDGESGAALGNEQPGVAYRDVPAVAHPVRHELRKYPTIRLLARASRSRSVNETWIFVDRASPSPS